MAYFLSCNNLTSPTCSVGNYVIDWHLNSTSGDVVFVSANSGNPESGVDAYHPIVDEVVPAGTLYAVIRYVYVGSDKITSEYEEGALYSPDLITCLGSIVIDPIDCTASNFTPTTILPYDFRINRNVGEGSKNREFIYSLNNTTQYVAVGFFADAIADALKIYYCTALDSTGVLIDHFLVGNNILTDNSSRVNYPTDPIIYRTQSSLNFVFKYVVDLTGFTYVSGDYLKFEVLGNVLNPLQDGTRWTVYLRCLDSLANPYDAVDIGQMSSTPAMRYDTTICSYLIEYDIVDWLENPLNMNGPNDSVYTYFTSLYNLTAGNTTVTGKGGVRLDWTETFSSLSRKTDTTCTAFAGTVTFSKVGSTFTFTFTNDSDYDFVKASIGDIVNNANYAQYLASTNADLSYYSWYQVNFYSSGTSCDNVVISNSVNFHPSSIITYDDVNKDSIIIEAVSITYGLDLPSPQTCRNQYFFAQNAVDLINNTISASNFSYSATFRRGDVVANTVANNTPSTIQYTVRSIYRRRIVQVGHMNNIFDLTGYNYCTETVNGNLAYTVYDTKDIGTLTDPSTPESRLTNYKLERSLEFTSDDCADLSTYEVIVDVVPTTTTTTTI